MESSRTFIAGSFGWLIQLLVGELEGLPKEYRPIATKTNRSNADYTPIGNRQRQSRVHLSSFAQSNSLVRFGFAARCEARALPRRWRPIVIGAMPLAGLALVDLKTANASSARKS
jgi:hypothetical protein